MTFYQAISFACSPKEPLYSLTEDAREFFAPNYVQEFFRVIDSRTKGRRIIRAVAIHADGSEAWLDDRTFEVHQDELEVVK